MTRMTFLVKYKHTVKCNRRRQNIKVSTPPSGIFGTNAQPFFFFLKHYGYIMYKRVRAPARGYIGNRYTYIQAYVYIRVYTYIPTNKYKDRNMEK